MALFFEHESIRRALQATGLCSEQPQTEILTTRPVLFGWSSKDVLLRQPGYAWLSLAESVYVRLPQPLKTIHDYLTLSLNPLVPSEQYRVLTTPLGQLHYAICRFQELPISDSSRLASAIEWRKFARKHWPGWYEEFFKELISSINDKKLTVPGLDVVRQHATDVAALTALRPLTDWLEVQSKADSIGTLEDVVAYTEQGLVSDQDLEDLGVNFDWLDQLETDLSSSELALRQIEESRFQVESSWSARLAVVSESLKTLRKLDVDFAGSPREARQAITTLTTALSEIIELRNRLKDTLNRCK